MNRESVLARRIYLTEQEKDNLRTLIASEGYRLLRDIVSSHCAENQASHWDSLLYDTEGAVAHVQSSKEAARKFNTALNVLDEVEANVDEWYRIELERRR